LQKTAGTLTVAAGTVFTFEDFADVTQEILTVLADTANANLNIGGTLVDGTVTGGTPITPTPGGSVVTTNVPDDAVAALGDSTKTGTAPVPISSGNYDLTGRSGSRT
jgi:hypothetical protein